MSCLTWVQFLRFPSPRQVPPHCWGGLLARAELGQGISLARRGRGGRGSRLSRSLHPQLGRWSLLPHPQGSAEQGGGAPVQRAHTRAHSCSHSSTQPEACPPPFLLLQSQPLFSRPHCHGNKAPEASLPRSQACFLPTPPWSASAPPAFLTNSAPFPSRQIPRAPPTGV